MQQLNIGVIGTGRIGRVHIENISVSIPEARILTIADPYVEAVGELATRFGIQAATHDYREVMENNEIDAVLICSPTDTHAQYVIEAAERGKHVFCEKPLDLSVDNIRRVLEVVERSGVRLMVGFNRRFDPNYAKVKQMVDEGKVGVPHIVKITSRDPDPPPIEYIRVSGGLFLDMTIHDFDMARFIVGDEVAEVYTKAGVRIDPAIGEAGDVDTAVTMLYFENGAIATIDNSRQSVYGYDQRLEVFGSDGMVMINNDTPDNHLRYDRAGQHGPLPLHFFMTRYTESYKVEIQTFINHIINNGEMPATGADGLASIAIGLAARRSYEINRPVRVRDVL